MRNPGFKIIRFSFFSFVMISVSFCITSTGKKDGEKEQKLLNPKADSLFYSESESVKNYMEMPEQSTASFPYDLENPDERYLLPDYLVEISGIAYYQKDKILGVQDEKADIYVLSLEKKGTVNRYKFGYKGDYEDIAFINKTAWVLRSDGRLFEIENFDKENGKVKEHNTALSDKNNTEGLMYDKSSNSLFIACKGSPSVEKDHPYKGYKAIYRFDITSMKLDKKPAFLIDINRPDSYRDLNLLTGFSINHKGKLQPAISENGFHPSGIAINPVNDQIYIISSAGKILVIIDRQGKILNLIDLDTKIFYQPEGICFSPSGDLYISNEGKGSYGYVLKFNLHNGK